MQRLRVRYAKRGRMRFTSHRDFSRAFERALARAEVPMAYSSGFSPHPRISYAGAAPTGAASEAEYLEIGLATRCDPEQVGRRIDDALPAGLDLVQVVPATAGPALADLLQASHWRLDHRADPDAVAVAVVRFLAAESVLVERMTKKGRRELDARAVTVSLAAAGQQLDLVLRHAVPSVRPDDVVSALEQTGAVAWPGPVLCCRLAQGLLDPVAGTISDPLLVVDPPADSTGMAPGR